jgi:hypothetical protein
MDREYQGLKGPLGEIEIHEQITNLGYILAYIRTGVGATISLWVDPLASEEQVFDQLDVRILALNLMINETLFGIRADHNTGNAQAEPILVDMRRDYMIVKAAPVIPGKENGRAAPIGSLINGVDQARRPGLTVAQ